MKNFMGKFPYRNFIILSVILIIILPGCAPAARNESAGSSPMEAPVAKDVSYGSSNTSALSSIPSQNSERMVIKNANLSIVVPDPSKSMDLISDMADEMGGFVVNANLYHETLDNGRQVPRASITFRIPAELLNDAIVKVKAESDQDPINEQITSQDITSEYTDMQSRLRNLLNTEAQLSEIMSQATKTEDVLAVYNQLVQVREQIEVLQGQIKYYDEVTDLSSIAVELFANEAIQPLTIGSWKPEGIIKNAVQTLINTVKGIANLVIWIIIYVVPVLLILFVVFFLPIRFIWKKLFVKSKKGKPALEDVPQAEPKSKE